MNVRHLELLRELSVRGTLTAVAAATHRTPSAVSQQLRTAEREFGVALVEPSSRGVRLTAEGQVLASGAEQVLAAIAEVQARLDATTAEPRGTVRIGALPSAGEALLPALVSRLHHSQIRLELDDFDLAEADYAARTLDVDIVIAHSLTGEVPAGAADLATQVLAREPLDVAVPSGDPLAVKTVLEPGDLAGTSWIGVPRGYPFDDVLITIEGLIGEPLERRLRLRDNRLVESLVATGWGLALLPRFTTRARDDVALRPLHGVGSVRNVVAMSRPDRHARLVVRTVLAMLADIGADLERAHGVA